MYLPSSVNTGTFYVSIIATDTQSKPYTGNASLSFRVDPMLHKDANGITINAKDVMQATQAI